MLADRRLGKNKIFSSSVKIGVWGKEEREKRYDRSQSRKMSFILLTTG